MTFKIPKIGFGGGEVTGALERLLAGTKKTEASPRSKVKRQAEPSLGEGWILLEGRQHEDYSYEDVYVAMHRLGISPEVERVAQELGIKVENTDKEKDGTKYIGNINWDEALRLNLQLGNFTLNPRQGIDLMLDLRAGIRGKKKLYDAKGNEIEGDRLKIMYNEMFGKRDPWRAEWLDAKFVKVGANIIIHSGHELVGNSLSPRYDSPIGDDYVKEDTAVSIKEFDKHGLAKQVSDKGNFCFYYPRNGAVAWFGADSFRAYLGCSGSPTYAGSQLGVRAACAKI